MFLEEVFFLQRIFFCLVVLLTYDLSNVRLESVMFLIVPEQFLVSVFIDFRLLELFAIYIHIWSTF